MGVYKEMRGISTLKIAVKTSLRSEKDHENIDIYQGFIEKFSFFRAEVSA